MKGGKIILCQQGVFEAMRETVSVYGFVKRGLERGGRDSEGWREGWSEEAFSGGSGKTRNSCMSYNELMH